MWQKKNSKKYKKEMSECGFAVVPVFGEDPETLSEHSNLAVSHG